MADNTRSQSTRSPNLSARWHLWLGATSLAAAMVFAIASAIVVAVSDGKDVNEWNIAPPAVLLAIFSAGTNAAFGSALATGIAVRFWQAALEGTQLSQLHYIWDHGRGLGLVSALRAGSMARIVAMLATLAYAVQFSSGPLLQRSTSQANQPRTTPENMTVNIAERIPDGWFGINENGNVTQGRKAMSQSQQWFLNSTIVQPDLDGYRCNGGACTGDVKGAGFTYSCGSSTRLLDMSTEASANFKTVFLIKAERELNRTGHTTLRLTISHISAIEGNCQATINTTVCRVTPAVVNYPVVITNSTLLLRDDNLTSPLEPISTLESEGDRPDAPNGAGVGPLAGLAKFVNSNFGAHDIIEFNDDAQRWLYQGPGTIGDVFFRAEPWDYSNHSLSTCGLVWDSPTQYVLTALHNYMFRVALRVGASADTGKQTFSVDKTTSVLVFRSDWRFLSAALGTILFGLCALGFLNWGAWELGRAVTLSPLETATLFISNDTGEPGGDRTLRNALKAGWTIDQILETAKKTNVFVGGRKAADNHPTTQLGNKEGVTGEGERLIQRSD